MSAFWEQVQPYVLTLIAGAITAAVAYLERLRRDLAENTRETKGAKEAAENGTALKERLAEEALFWRKEAMRAQIKSRRGEAIEEAMKLSPEGRAFLAVLEKNYGWRVVADEQKDHV